MDTEHKTVVIIQLLKTTKVINKGKKNVLKMIK